MNLSGEVNASELTLSQFLNELEVFFTELSPLPRFVLNWRFGLVPQEGGEGFFGLISAESFIGI